MSHTNHHFSHPSYDVVVIGAGAAGLMAAATAAARGRRVLVLEHTDKIGEKIRISGGGRCNFTNLYASSQNYLCANPHFVKSALAGYSVQDFIKQVEFYGIEYYEKTLGQLFCLGSSKQIIQMLVDMGRQHGVEITTGCNVHQITQADGFWLGTNKGTVACKRVIIASGGLSIPKIGASSFAYRIAEQFGLNIIPPRPALVPLILSAACAQYTQLSGVSNFSKVSHGAISFEENILLTHRGLSGPAILQISSYLNPTQDACINIDLLPYLSLTEHLADHKYSKQTVHNHLKQHLSQRLLEHLLPMELSSKRLTDLSKKDVQYISNSIHAWNVTLAGDEGYKKAEVTAGGVDTHELSSKTMESKKNPGLFWVGEAVDVTGWLGGYNFQWAWSSGFAAGSAC